MPYSQFYTLSNIKASEIKWNIFPDDIWELTSGLGGLMGIFLGWYVPHVQNTGKISIRHQNSSFTQRISIQWICIHSGNLCLPLISRMFFIPVIMDFLLIIHLSSGTSCSSSCTCTRQGRRWSFKSGWKRESRRKRKRRRRRDREKDRRTQTKKACIIGLLVSIIDLSKIYEFSRCL